MIGALRRLFAPPAAEQLLHEQLAAAQRAYLEHAAAAEYHSAMVGMLDGRITRLTKEIHNEVHA
jgi:hypothetical protein